jgi:hypothetical protein
MNKNEQFVKSIYPTAHVTHTSPGGGAWMGIIQYRVYQAHSINEIGCYNEIGVGNTEGWAWYMAVKYIQKECLKKLEV